MADLFESDLPLDGLVEVASRMMGDDAASQGQRTHGIGNGELSGDFGGATTNGGFNQRPRSNDINTFHLDNLTDNMACDGQRESYNNGRSDEIMNNIMAHGVLDDGLHANNTQLDPVFNSGMNSHLDNGTHIDSINNSQSEETLDGSTATDDLDHDLHDETEYDEAVPGSAPGDTSEISVLFRPTKKLRNSNRPTMGLMFRELQLVPHNYLKLTSEAKAYMLDPNHPERRNVTGERKDSAAQDAARMRLWGSVEDFLKVRGAGEKYFARSVEGRNRTMFWPDDTKVIMMAMMHLMRKMATNEQQRVYANQRRKRKAQEKLRAQEAEVAAVSVPATPMSSSVDLAAPPVVTPAGKVSVNIMREQPGGLLKRLMPRFYLDSDHVFDMSAVFGQIQARICEPATVAAFPELATASMERHIFKVWDEAGLRVIADEADWVVALLTAENLEWMDRELRVVIIV